MSLTSVCRHHSGFLQMFWTQRMKWWAGLYVCLWQSAGLDCCVSLSEVKKWSSESLHTVGLENTWHVSGLCDVMNFCPDKLLCSLMNEWICRERVNFPTCVESVSFCWALRSGSYYKTLALSPNHSSCSLFVITIICLFSVRVFRSSTRRTGWRTSHRLSTLSCQKHPRLSLQNLFLSCRARWDERGEGRW